MSDSRPGLLDLIREQLAVEDCNVAQNASEPPTVALDLSQGQPTTSYVEADLIAAFTAGMQEGCEYFSDHCLDQGDEAAVAVFARRYMRKLKFDLQPETVFIGSLRWKPSRYNDEFSMREGPVLVGKKPTGELTFSCIFGTVDLDDTTLDYYVTSIIYDPARPWK